MPTGFNFLSLVLILAVFYFFLILPEQRKQKKMKSMLDSLTEGNTVVTRGGIYGKIVKISNDIITLETGPDKIRVDVTRLGIGSVVDVRSEAAPETAVDQISEAETVSEKEEEKTE